MTPWAWPSSPTARRAALTREVSADSDTNRSPQMVSSSSSLGTTRSWLTIRWRSSSNTWGSTWTGAGRTGERELASSSTKSPNRKPTTRSWSHSVTARVQEAGRRRARNRRRGRRGTGWPRRLSDSSSFARGGPPRRPGRRGPCFLLSGGQVEEAFACAHSTAGPVRTTTSTSVDVTDRGGMGSPADDLVPTDLGAGRQDRRRAVIGDPGGLAGDDDGQLPGSVPGQGHRPPGRQAQAVGVGRQRRQPRRAGAATRTSSRGPDVRPPRRVGRWSRGNLMPA